MKNERAKFKNDKTCVQQANKSLSCAQLIPIGIYKSRVIVNNMTIFEGELLFSIISSPGVSLAVV